MSRRDPLCMAEHQSPPLGECTCDAYTRGQRDALAGLDNAEVWGRVMQVLDNNGINTEYGGIHSWRCFDKERYPEPCSCAAEVVVEIIAAIKGEP